MQILLKNILFNTHKKYLAPNNNPQLKKLVKDERKVQFASTKSTKINKIRAHPETPGVDDS